MKKPIFLLFAMLLTAKLFSQDLIIKDISIIPMTANTVIENKSVAVENGKIIAIGDFKKINKNKRAKIISGKGKYLMPALADMHVHLPEESKIEKHLLSNIVAGVTQIRVMNSSVSQTDLKKKFKENQNLISPKFISAI